MILMTLKANYFPGPFVFLRWKRNHRYVIVKYAVTFFFPCGVKPWRVLTSSSMPRKSSRPYPPSRLLNSSGYLGLRSIFSWVPRSYLPSGLSSRNFLRTPSCSILQTCHNQRILQAFKELTMSGYQNMSRS